jgi:hypothetical protein
MAQGDTGAVPAFPIRYQVRLLTARKVLRLGLIPKTPTSLRNEPRPPPSAERASQQARRPTPEDTRAETWKEEVGRIDMTSPYKNSQHDYCI